MMTKFVTGEEPLANWDVYITQLKKFGLDSWEKACQMTYERMLSF
jgi:putative aldouronate transport system substrate-binding protein